MANQFSSRDETVDRSQKLSGYLLEEGTNSSGSGYDVSVEAENSDSSHNYSTGNPSNDMGLQLTCFSEESHDMTLHFQVIRFTNQIYVWIGCNTARFGHLYASALTRPNNTPSVTTLLGGGADSTGASIARRLVMRTGLNIILACNIPKNSPMLEAHAERTLIQKLKNLGYIEDGKKRLSGAHISNREIYGSTCD